MRSFIVAGAAVGLVFTAGAAQAQFKGAGKYQAGILEYETNATDFSFAKEKSKVQIKPSKKDGDGGFVIQLNGKFIDCPAVGNDKGKDGKCGEKGFPVEGHVMELTLHVLGVLSTRTAILYDIEKGKARFQETGKNKQGAGSAGSLVTVLFKTSIGIDRIRLREPGSDPTNPTTGCDVLPLPDGDTCTDGGIYGIAGIRVGEDLSLTCTTTAECDNGGTNPALICSTGTCTTESCSVDADCDQDGGGSGGTGECDCGTGLCCDPAISPGCDTIC